MMPRLRSKNFLIPLAALLIGLIPALIFYVKFQHAQYLLDNPALAAKEESQSLTSSIGRWVELPSDEDPSFATITDLSKVGAQPVFSKAKVGDKVLIYSKANKVIIYRPSTNRIVVIGGLNVS